MATSLHITPPANPSSTNYTKKTTGEENGTKETPSFSPSTNSNLDISYSKLDPSSPYPMMNIKLNLIDQNALNSNIMTPNGEAASCESPFPMTPGGSLDMSKKQRHNLREQRRILRISNQFDILRLKLERAGYQSSKKDKYSVLQATLDYITNLERNQINGADNRPSQAHQQYQLLQMQPDAPPTHTMTDKSGPPSFVMDSMPSPVPAFPTMQFPMNPMDTTMFSSPSTDVTPPSFPLECIEGSTATYKDVFGNSSMPSLLAKLDGTIVEANGLFLELCCKNIDELRLHSLYTMCTAMDASKMYNLVNKILSCEMASAQSKMMWHFSPTGDRKVFVSVSMVHDKMHQAANLHCSLLPLS